MTQNRSTLVTDLTCGFELAELLSEVRANETLQNLYYTQEVMRAIKKVPKVTPPIRAIKLSELVPTVKEEEPMLEQLPQRPEKPSWFTKIRSKVRKRKR